MKAWYYRSQHVDMEQFPPGYFKLAGFEVTNNPHEADCFVLPCDLRHVTDEQILNLRYLKGNEQRHVFFSLSEFPQRALPIDAIAFRADYNESLRRKNPNTVTQAWPVEDLQEYVGISETGFLFDVHAQLWASDKITDVAVESCVRAGLNVHDQRQSFFYGTLETNQDERLPLLRKTFLDSMSISRLVLVPRSRPFVNRYRFYEALSMGRIPVLLCDGNILPFQEMIAGIKIEWQRCMISIAERDAARCGDILVNRLANLSFDEKLDETLLEMGAYGRQVWHNYLAPHAWEVMWGRVVQAKLEALK